MIYGVSRNGMHGIGYSKPIRNEPSVSKAKSLYECFVPSGTILPDPLPAEVAKPPLKKGSFSMSKYHAKIPLHYHVETPKVIRTSGGTNKKGPRKWVPKDKIIYVADILDSSNETPIMVSGQWMLASHDGRKAYVPRAKT